MGYRGTMARKKALARAAQLAAAPRDDAPPTSRIAPLKCPSCDAPLPLGQGETAVCTFCHAAVPLPAEYRELRDAEQQRTADRDRAEQLYRELGSPPSAALRLWARFAEIATTALFGIVVAILTVCASLMLLAGFALELVLHAVAPLIRIDLIDRFGGGTVYAGFVVIIVAGALLPMWAFGYFDSLAEIKRTLQANLAAIPPQKPGFPATCRECGAALDVPTGAYGVRCAYCQSDNIVSLPREWLASFGVTEKTFHRSIVTAVELAAKLRADARAGLPSAAAWSLAAIVVFGLVGRGCSALDSESVVLAYRQSMGPPRQMFSHWTPNVGVPSDTMAPFEHLEYSLALRHGETLSWSSNDEGWGGTIEIKNTTSFPFLTKGWERPWVPQTDGTYGATFVAPYTGLFVVKLHTRDLTEGGTHLRWTAGDARTLPQPGIPSPPQIASAAAEPIVPSPLPEPAKALAEKLEARLAVTAADRKNVLVTSGSHAGPNQDIIVTTISTGKKEQSFGRDAPIVAMAMSRDGHALATATPNAIVPAEIADRLFDSGNSAALPQSAGAVALAFIDNTVFASGGADGVIKIWDARRGMQLYQLAKLPGAITALAVSADGLTLTATFAHGARSFTVPNIAVWSQHG
jgi:LSD1 subclass zinc finger protein